MVYTDINVLPACLYLTESLDSSGGLCEGLSGKGANNLGFRDVCQYLWLLSTLHRSQHGKSLLPLAFHNKAAPSTMTANLLQALTALF